MENNEVIIFKDVYKSFKVYQDKSHTITDRILTRGRNKYNLHPVIKGANFSIRKGEVIGLIGENGSGKSTALKLMNRTIYPDKGNVVVQGKVSSLIELGAGFHPDLSGRENIYTNASIFGLKKKEIEDRINDIIDFSELWDFIDNPVRTYSSGMYMRLAFSVAINMNAEILLVDEILAVGDKNFSKKCIDKMKDLKKQGITIVIVTHDTSSVETICTRALWINDGVVAADGLPEYVINKYSEFMYDKRLEMEKRLEEERRKADQLNKDFSKDDIIELYQKYLYRDPENEDTINYYFKFFDKKRDIEHYIKYSPERIALTKVQKQKNENIQNSITRQEIINAYQKLLNREPENEKVIEDCCKTFFSLDDLINTIKNSPEYKIVEKQRQISEKSKINIDEILFKDNNEKKVDKLISGNSYFFDINFTINEKIESFIFNVEIYAVNGYLCFFSQTKKLDLVASSIEKTIIRLTIPSIELFPGKYKIFVTVVDTSNIMIDRKVIEMGIIPKGKKPIPNNDWKIIKT
jgi:ABC-type polysaccharide/polyol phosphate transport system ATPase subunit